MKIFRILILCVTVSYTIIIAELKFDINDFPDSLDVNKNTLLTVIFENVGLDTISIRKAQNCLTLIIRNGSGKQVQITRNQNRSNVYRLVPGQKIGEKILLTPKTFKDSLDCPKVNYDNCKNANDTIRAHIIGLCSEQKFGEPLKTGKYIITVFADIVEQNSKDFIKRFEREIIIK